MNNSDVIPFEWVDSDAGLRQCIEHCRALSSDYPYLIIDTEFERTNTYYANPGVIQLAIAGSIYLIDPVAVSSLKPLAQLLEDPAIEVVLHSMSEDIDLLSHYCDCSITSVFDTQIAAAFLGMGLAVGYQRLVEMVLGVELEKGETRSDWLRRPLSDKQLHYAAADVFYLEDVYFKLRAQLEQSPWLSAVQEECSRQVSVIESAGTDPDNAYLKLRGAWDLPEARQCLLKSLVAWRDTEAVNKNIPKSWVFSDAQLIEAARTLPKSQGALFKLPKIKPKSVKRFGDELLSLLELSDLQVPNNFVPVERPIKGKELEFYKRIKKLVTSAAAKAGIEAQLIAGRKQMEAWTIYYLRKNGKGLPAGIDGWRTELIAVNMQRLAEDRTL